METCTNKNYLMRWCDCNLNIYLRYILFIVYKALLDQLTITKAEVTLNTIEILLSKFIQINF